LGEANFLESLKSSHIFVIMFCVLNRMSALTISVRYFEGAVFWISTILKVH